MPLIPALDSGRQLGFQFSRRRCHRRNNRCADQVIKSAQCRLRAIACRNDNLLERHRGGIARCKHARHRGLAFAVNDDFTVLGQLDRALSRTSSK